MTPFLLIVIGLGVVILATLRAAEWLEARTETVTIAHLSCERCGNHWMVHADALKHVCRCPFHGDPEAVVVSELEGVPNEPNE